MIPAIREFTNCQERHSLKMHAYMSDEHFEVCYESMWEHKI